MTEAPPRPKSLPAIKCVERAAGPVAIVIFGASGDLTAKKVLPAFFDLYEEKLLSERTRIVGFARSAMDDAAFRLQMRAAVKAHSRHRDAPDAEWEEFSSRLSYVQGDYAQSQSFERLKSHLERLDSESRLGGNRLFYLATPPNRFGDTVRGLGRSGLAAPKGEGWARLIVEKPFGSDLESARVLNRALREWFEESQLYRIDHYLGKETVQNLLVFRFANGIFEPLWNRQHVDHVQIASMETIGIERRAGYYEHAGALRDMFQNHMLQLVSLVAMEPPAAFDADAVRNEKVKVLQSLKPLSGEDVDRSCVRGQYGPGRAETGEELRGYRQEPGVEPDSAMETYFAARVQIDNWRWSGVPFYIRTGKRINRRATEIAIVFKRPPYAVFRDEEAAPNILKLSIQPDEGISLSFGAKIPGQSLHLGPVVMDFKYAQSFGAVPIEAYERLLMDCLLGDPTLFDRFDCVEAAWGYVAPALARWAEVPAPVFPNYAAGSWGPAEADALLKADGRRWIKPGETS